ncbi:hypothetical protein PMAG_a1152 [Pseudoalteromonas mariniglutinosa NCIMB 1770]|nr:hypothetical protein [Pseudoalteromonas mariniglutinosa NCIMB 1770]
MGKKKWLYDHKSNNQVLGKGFWAELRSKEPLKYSILWIKYIRLKY